MAASYSDLTRAAARIMDTFVECAFEMSDADPAELAEVFEHMKIGGVDQRLIDALKAQIEDQEKVNRAIEEEDK